jgi:hypothetical protein
MPVEKGWPVEMSAGTCNKLTTLYIDSCGL